MRTLATLSVVYLLALSAYAADVTPAGSGATLRGRVTLPGGAPVEGALVRVEGMRALHAFSDANGAYAIARVPHGTATIHFSKPGFLQESQTIEVLGGEVRTDAELSRGLSLRGRVVDAARRPIHGARIVAHLSDRRPGSWSTVSDVDGAFVIEGLPRGFYDLEFTMRGHGTAVPRGVDPATTTELTIALGAEGIIEGRVAGLAEGETATVTARTGGMTRHAKVDADGTYRLDGLPGGTIGMFVKTVRRGQGGTATPWREVALPVGGERRIDWDLGGPAARGRITVDGAPVERALVTLVGAERKDDGALRPARGTATARTDANGTYEVRGVGAGLYVLTVIARDGAAPFETECAVAEDACDVDLTGGPVEIAVTDATTGAPIGAAAVRVASASRIFATPVRVAADRDGIARLAFLPAGAYEVLASAPGHAAAVLRVTVPPARPVPVELALRPETPTTIRVVDATSGRPAAATIAIEAIDGPPVAESELPAPDGTTAIAVPPGSYRLLASAPGLAPRTVEVTLPRTEPVEIALTAGGDIVVANASRAEGRLRVTRTDVASAIVAAALPADCMLRSRAADAIFRSLEPGRYRIDLLDANETSLRHVELTLREGKVLKVTW